jgi:MoxR-like ATPase
VTAFEKQLDIEQRLPAEEGGNADSDAGKLALARSLGASQPEGENGNGMLRFVASTLEEQQRRRFSPVHVAARLAQVDAVAQRAEAARAEVAAALYALAGRLDRRLWLPPTLADGWLGAHTQTLDAVAGLQARLAATRAGFAAHPVDKALPAVAPAPVALDAA